VINDIVDDSISKISVVTLYTVNTSNGSTSFINDNRVYIKRNIYTDE
jgi:hypothetical protein